MFIIFSATVVDSRTDRLGYYCFKFKGLTFETYKEVTELQQLLNSTFNINNKTHTDYIVYAGENYTYGANMQEPVDVKVNSIQDILQFAKNKKGG